VRKKEIIEWITKNIPRGFVVEKEPSMELEDGESLTCDLKITTEDLEDCGYCLKFIDRDGDEYLRAIVELTLFCSLGRIKRGIIVYCEKVKEYECNLAGITIRVLGFSEEGEIQESGEEFFDELFDE